MSDELFITEDGRFQMPSEQLAGFAAYLRENGVLCDLDPAGAFQSEGHSYAFGRLHHLYDLESTQKLYRVWRETADV